LCICQEGHRHNAATRHAPDRLPVSDVDLRLLRVFSTIVACNGFSAAQDSLGMTQATISTHMLPVITYIVGLVF